MTNDYATNDLWFASVLLALGYRIVRVEGAFPKKRLVFDLDYEEARTIRLDYMRDDLDVNARTLLASNATVKQMVRD